MGLECVVCEKEFSSEKALEKHRIALHSGIADQDDKYVMPKPVLYCDLCDYSCKYRLLWTNTRSLLMKNPVIKILKKMGKRRRLLLLVYLLTKKIRPIQWRKRREIQIQSRKKLLVKRMKKKKILRLKC